MAHGEHTNIPLFFIGTAGTQSLAILARHGLVLASIGCNAPYADSGRSFLHDNALQGFEKRSERVGIIRIEHPGNR